MKYSILLIFLIGCSSNSTIKVKPSNGSTYIQPKTETIYIQPKKQKVKKQIKKEQVIFNPVSNYRNGVNQDKHLLKIKRKEHFIKH